MKQVPTLVSARRAHFRTELGALVFAALLLFVALPIMAPRAEAGTVCTITWDGDLSIRWFELDPGPTGDPGDDITNWSPERWPNSTDHACFPDGADATTNQVTTNTPDVLSFTIFPGGTLSVTDVQLIARENSTNAGQLFMSGNVPLTINDSDPNDAGEGLTNTGAISFTTGGAAGLSTIVSELFTNQGRIDVDRPLAGIQRPGAAFSATALHTNKGLIDISSGNTLRSIFSNFVNGTGGVITGDGTMNMDQGRFAALGNSQIVPPTDVNMTNSVFAGTAASNATGNVDVIGAFAGGGPSTLEGTVPDGITLDVEPAVTLRSPAVTTTVNEGRINLNGPGSHLQILPNDGSENSTSKLTNTGTIEFTPDNPPASGLRLITGHLDNQGTLLVNDPEASFQDPGGTKTPPKLTNTGTITISAGSVLRVIQNTTVTNGVGGIINGSGIVNHGNGAHLNVTGNSLIGRNVDYNLTGEGSDLTFLGAAAGNVDINGAGFDPADLTGNVPATFSLDVQNAVLRSVSSFTNAGTITLNRAAGDSFDAALRTEDGNPDTTETLTNTGSIKFTGTLGSPRVSGDLINRGTINVANPNVRFESESEPRTPRLTNAASGSFTVAPGGLFALVPGEASFFKNAGTVLVNGTLAPISYTQTGGTTTLGTATSQIGLSPPDGVLALQGGVLRGKGSVTNGNVNNAGGTVIPGTSPGTLTFNSNYTQGPNGKLAVEVSGAEAGTGYDQLAVGGTVSLDGTLKLATPGFNPSAGQLFKIIDAPAPPDPSVTGTFATVQETGRHYAVKYNPTDVTLKAAATRTVSLSLKNHLIAEGQLSSSRPKCLDAVITLERRKSTGWAEVKNVPTKGDGSYQTNLPDQPGTYRAQVGTTDDCGGDLSPTRSHTH